MQRMDTTKQEHIVQCRALERWDVLLQSPDRFKIEQGINYFCNSASSSLLLLRPGQRSIDRSCMRLMHHISPTCRCKHIRRSPTSRQLQASQACQSIWSLMIYMVRVSLGSQASTVFFRSIFSGCRFFCSSEMISTVNRMCRVPVQEIRACFALVEWMMIVMHNIFDYELQICRLVMRDVHTCGCGRHKLELLCCGFVWSVLSCGIICFVFCLKVVLLLESWSPWYFSFRFCLRESEWKKVKTHRFLSFLLFDWRQTFFFNWRLTGLFFLGLPIVRSSTLKINHFFTSWRDKMNLLLLLYP